MATRYLLDTNICIYITKARPPSVLTRFRLLAPGAVAMSAITWGELCHGAEKSTQRDIVCATLARLRDLIPVMPVDAATGSHYGEILTSLQREGRIIGVNDLWIAAQARAQGLTLVSNNTREFERVRGLALENWV